VTYLVNIFFCNEVPNSCFKIFTSTNEEISLMELQKERVELQKERKTGGA
jgi:hypothetical protein